MSKVSTNKLELLKKQTQEIKLLARGQWTSILAGINPQIAGAAEGFTGAKRPGCPCPHHDSKSKTSFRFLKSGNETGACGCYTCAPGGVWKDGFTYLMDTLSISFSEAVRLVGDELGYDFNNSFIDEVELQRKIEEAERERAKQAEIKKQEDIKERDKQLSILSKMWSESFALDTPEALPARKYFLNRGLGDVGTLRGEVVFHPSLSYYKEDKEGELAFAGNFPCILSQVRNPQGYPIRIHRTYITDDGVKLDVGDSAKKLTQDVPLIPLTGASIQLSPAGTKVLGVGEGLETILAAMKITNMPTQCCINAQLLSSWMPAKGTEVVFIWADRDVSRTGELRANELAERLQKHNIKTIICLPPMKIPTGEKGIDWADALLAMGESAFPIDAMEWYKFL